VNWTNLAFSYYYADQPEKALAILDSGSLIFNTPDIFYTKARVSIYLSRYQEVIDNLNREFAMSPGDRELPRLQAWLAISHFHTGRSDEAERILDSLKFRSKKSPAGSPAFHAAMIYANTGRKELAFEWLEKAYKNHEVEMHWLKADRLFNPLHNDPQFQNLLLRIGFKK
jgi:tetratricopeptide (TPR) repeat protein